VGAKKGSSGAGIKDIKRHKLPKAAHICMLRKLREYLGVLNTQNSDKTAWGDYATSTGKL
jgi:hypothetical protein